MQKLRRFNFFDRHVVKQDGADIHLDIQKLGVVCACGSAQHLWLGERGGGVRRLDRQFVLTAPTQLFETELIDIRIVEGRHLLVALGVDTPTSGGTRYKVFDARGDSGPVPKVVNRVFPPRGAENRATCFIPSSTFGLLAVGTDTGAVNLFRGRDLAQDKPYPTILAEEGDPPVTAVHFLEQGKRTVLFICNMVAVKSWLVQDRDDQEVRQLHVDCSGGVSEKCSCVFPITNALLVAKGDAIFAYDPDEGNMSAMPLEGDKVILQQFKSYFVSVTSESGQGAGNFVPATHSTMPKQNVIVCLAYPHMRFIAYSSQFTDVTHIVTGMGSIFVLSRGGADGNTVLFELREKELSERLDILVKKRMFEWAAEVGLQGAAAPETIADIYRQHGDALFEKRGYDQALAVYTKTVDLGLPLEPSYIVERYLDAQRIGHVAKYLKKLHECDIAEREHTALLLKCYTKLKDFSTLEEFLETTPVTQYDPATAIEVLESAGYYGLASAVAQKVERREDYVRISLEHFKSYTKIVDYLQSLPKPEASKLLLEHGRQLLKHCPRDTIELVQHLCGMKGGGQEVPPVDGPRVDEFLPIFVDDLAQLEQFLRGILLSPTGSPPPCGKRLYPTLLELLVRAHSKLRESAQEAVDQGHKAEEEEEEEKRSKLHGEIMRLIRQYPSEDDLASTLMLCQTYGFVDGLFHAAERLGQFQLLMNWCFGQRDAKRLLQVCKRCGSIDQSLWVQALSFLAADEGDHLEEISEVLSHIEESDLMPLLMVIETLQHKSKLTVGAVRPYLQGQFRKLGESVETSRGKAMQDRQEIERMQQEISSLRTKAQVFQNMKCFQCQLTLEVPAVHLFCGHSYHSYCMPADGRCPKCSSEALPKITLKKQREAQARNTEDFFKYLRGGGGESGVQAIGDWCKFGAFDASTGHDEHVA